MTTHTAMRPKWFRFYCRKKEQLNNPLPIAFHKKKELFEIMKDRSKLKSFFLGDLDDYGIILLVLFFLTMYSPALNRNIGINLAPISITAYLVCYLLRFRAKDTRNWWEISKLGITLIVFLFTIEKFLVAQFGDLPHFISITTWWFLYYIDRAALRTFGKLNNLITAAVMLITIFFVTFANLHAKEAVKQKEISEKLAKETKFLKLEAEKITANALEAEAKLAELEAQLKKCIETNQPNP